MNNITQLLSGAMRVLGGDHAIRVGIGTLVGLIFLGGQNYLVAAFPNLQYIKALAQIGLAPSIALGLCVAFLPLSFRKNVLPESYQMVFAAIDEAALRKGFTELQRRNAYSVAMNKILDRFNPGVGDGKINKDESLSIANDAVKETEQTVGK